MKALASIGLVIAAVAAVAAAGIGVKKAVSKVNKNSAVQSPQDEKAFNDGMVSFAGKFVPTAPVEKGSNIAYSPLSFELALMMLGPGLGNQDQAKLGQALGVTPQFFDESSQVMSFVEAMKAKDTVISNSVWVAPDTKLIPAYQDSILNRFGAGAYRLAGLHQTGADQINQWVNESTKGRIQKLFDSLEDSTRLVLVNAVTFDGTWTTPFDPELTKQEPWYGMDGSQKEVEMMNGTPEIRIAKQDGFEVARLPYRGIGACMDVILPQKGSDPWQTLSSNASTLFSPNGLRFSVPAEYVKMPRFTFSTNQNITASMDSLGLGSFLKQLDDQKITGTDGPNQLYISQVQQAVYIKVDEHGTKAAAATGIGIRATAIMAGPAKEPFVVDHPFAFVIRDLKTGSILFVGAVYNP